MEDPAGHESPGCGAGVGAGVGGGVGGGVGPGQVPRMKHGRPERLRRPPAEPAVASLLGGAEPRGCCQGELCRGELGKGKRKRQVEERRKGGETFVVFPRQPQSTTAAMSNLFCCKSSGFQVVRPRSGSSFLFEF